MDPGRLAAQQLGRMRGMIRFYHERFFSDVRFTTLSLLSLFVLGAWEVPLAYLLIPPVAVLGASQTAFDASYLIFSRHYATSLERRLNEVAGARVLVANEMEDAYLFPLDTRKVVTVPVKGPFTWFGFMTLLYTALGIIAFGFGLALGWDTLMSSGLGWTVSYLGALGLVTVSCLVVGWWWFVGGVGERRLTAILDTVTWPQPTETVTN